MLTGREERRQENTAVFCWHRKARKQGAVIALELEVTIFAEKLS